MEQMPKVKDFHKRKACASKKKGMGKKGDVFEVGKVCCLPDMCVLSSDAVSSSISGTKNPLPQKWDTKWRVQTPELKERISHQNLHMSHDNSHYMDKIIKTRSAVDALQPSVLNDYEMFPPLNSQRGMLKREKNPVTASQFITQHEAKKNTWKQEQENNAKTTKQPLLPLENKSACKASNFWTIRREKTFFAQAGGRKETIASLHEISESDMHLTSDTQNKVNKHIKISSTSVSFKELSLNSRQKSNKQESDKGSLSTDEECFIDKASSGYFSCFEKSHAKKKPRKNLYLSIENNIALQLVSRHLEDNLYDSDNSCQKSDTSQQSYSVLESSLDRGDASSTSEYTQTSYDSTEEDLFCHSKIHIISHLKILLKKEFQSSGGEDAAETKCLALPECLITDEPALRPDTVDEGVTLNTEEKMSHEEYLVWEEMLNNYVVFCNLPFGVSKEEILYHMHKVGSVCYIVMEKNRAHIIFLKAEEADLAFGLKHVLFGRQLVVCRPKRAACTLHLSGLTNNTPNEDVIKMVSSYGVVIGFYRPTNKFSTFPMRYCFIKVDKQVAENILKQSSLIVNNVRIFAEVSSQSEVKVSSNTYSSQQPLSVLAPFHFHGSYDEFKVLLTNVPRYATYDLIKEHFQEFGKLKKVFVKDKKGFVIFASQDSLEQALSSKHTILGTEVKLSQAS